MDFYFEKPKRVKFQYKYYPKKNFWAFGIAHFDEIIDPHTEE